MKPRNHDGPDTSRLAPALLTPREREHLPGDAGHPPPGMQDYVITLKPEDARFTGRGEVVKRNLDRTRQFRHTLQRFLKRERLIDQVNQIGPAMRLPMLAVVCTPMVADRIRALPDVKAVVADVEMPARL